MSTAAPFSVSLVTIMPSVMSGSVVERGTLGAKIFWSSRIWMLVIGIGLVLWITAVSVPEMTDVVGSSEAWMV